MEQAKNNGVNMKMHCFQCDTDLCADDYVDEVSSCFNFYNFSDTKKNINIYYLIFLIF